MVVVAAFRTRGYLLPTASRKARMLKKEYRGRAYKHNAKSLSSHHDDLVRLESIVVLACAIRLVVEDRRKRE